MDGLKNIVIINDFDYVQGGASKVAIQTANELAKQYGDINVYFFSGVHNNNSNLNNKVINICTNQVEALKDKNIFRGIINGLYNFKARRTLKNLLNTLDSNNTIIHIHGWTKVLSSSVFDIIFKMKFKMVLTMHDYFISCPNGGYFNYKSDSVCQFKPLSLKCIKCNCDSRNYLFKLYRLIRQFIQNKMVRLNYKLRNVITISEFSEKILKNTLNSNINLYRVYNPIEFSDSKKNCNYKKNQYFLYVGRVTKEKGVDVFCEAITKTNQKGVVVGDGPELTRLKDKYKNIKFVGWKDSNNVKKYMLEAKCLVFPSKWYETMGMTVIEAQNSGLPVIVNKNTAASEFVKDNRFKYDKFSDLLKIINDFDRYNFAFYSYHNDYIVDLFKVYNQIYRGK